MAVVLTEGLRILREEHTVEAVAATIPPPMPTTRHHTCFGSTVVVTVAAEDENQWAVWPFPNPDARYNRWELATRPPGPRNGTFTAAPDVRLVASLEELAVALPRSALASNRGETAIRYLAETYPEHGLAAVRLTASGTFGFGWVWQGAHAYVPARWMAGETPAPLVATVHGNSHLRWASPGLIDTQPRQRCDRAASGAIVTTVVSLEAPNRRRNSDLVACASGNSGGTRTKHGPAQEKECAVM